MTRWDRPGFSACKRKRRATRAGVPRSAVLSLKSFTSNRSRTTPDARFTCDPSPSNVATRPSGRIARTLLLRYSGK